jgi:hypothetical protein
VSEQHDNPLDFRPPPGIALPAHRSAEIAKLTAEARHLHAARCANCAEIDRRNALNVAISDRLGRIESEIRAHVWDDKPPATVR